MAKSGDVSSPKPSLDQMWQFIDNIMRPNELIPDKTSLTYEQVMQYIQNWLK